MSGRVRVFDDLNVETNKLFSEKSYQTIHYSPEKDVEPSNLKVQNGDFTESVIRKV